MPRGVLAFKLSTNVIRSGLLCNFPKNSTLLFIGKWNLPVTLNDPVLHRRWQSGSVLCWITLQSLPATFEMAFAGNQEELNKKLELSYGLLDKLLDKQIINRRQYQVIQVLRSCLCLLQCLLEIFIYWQNFYVFHYTLYVNFSAVYNFGK